MSKSLVSTAAELNGFLEEKFKYDWHLIEEISDATGTIIGELYSEKVFIMFVSGKSLVVATIYNSRGVLNQLLPTLAEVMGNENPICSYCVQNKYTEAIGILPIIEWNILEPEKRIKEIANGRAYADAMIVDLELYGDRKVDDYLESEEEKTAKIHDTDSYDFISSLAEQLQEENINSIFGNFASNLAHNGLLSARHVLSEDEVERFNEKLSQKIKCSNRKN